MAGSADLRLHFFGYPHAESNGVRIDLRSRKAWGLLAYLHVTQMAHSREFLSTLLWPDQPADRGQASLRNLLWMLNRTDLGACVEATRTTLSSSRGDGIFVDVAAFRDATAPAGPEADPDALAGAVRLYRGHFLDGLHIDGSAAFEDWVLIESSALRSELAEIVETMSQFDTAKPGMHRALASARRWLGLAESDRDAPGYGRGRSAVRGVPRFRMPWIGREKELALIADALDETCRGFITLAGPGGAGKTHLAAMAAAECAGRFAEGAVFVSLAHVETARDFILSVGEALGLPLARAIPSGGSRDQLPLDSVELLRDRDMLLVLDNVEQLPGAYAWIAALAGSTTRTRILVTSRHQLGLRAERVIPVEGLELPKPSDDADDACESEAVRLFVAAARQVLPGFSPSEADVQVIAAACLRLHGMPLAIELAASWVRSATCAEIKTMLEEAIDQLESSELDVPQRHRSLRAVFLRSWNLLSREERAAFRRLAIFHGPFTAAEASEIADLPAATLSTFVRKSLVHRTRDGRYRLLRIVQHLVAERLRALPEEHARLHARHADHFLRFLVEKGETLRSPRQRDAAEAIARSFENIEAAWRHAIAAGQSENLLPTIRPLFTYLQMRNCFVDGVSLFGALEDAEMRSQPGPGALLAGIGALYRGWFLVYDVEARGVDGLRRARSKLSELGAPSGILAMANVLASFVEIGTRSERTVTRKELEWSRERLAGSGDEDGAALATEAVALLIAEDAPEEAQALLEDVIGVRSKAGDEWGLACALSAMGSALLRRCDGDAAEIALKRALAVHQRITLDPFNEMGVWSSLAVISNGQGRFGDSRDQYRRAYDLARIIGARVAIGSTAECLAITFYALGDMETARRHAQEAMQSYRAGGDAKRLARCQTFIDERLRPEQGSSAQQP